MLQLMSKIFLTESIQNALSDQTTSQTEEWMKIIFTTYIPILQEKTTYG